MIKKYKMDFIDIYIEEINESILQSSKYLGSAQFCTINDIINTKKNTLFQKIVNYFLECNESLDLPCLYAILNDHLFCRSSYGLSLINIIHLKQNLETHYKYIVNKNKC
jgi:hypothetical protein